MKIKHIDIIGIGGIPEDSLTWHDAEISKNANSDQGFYDI